MLTEPMTVYISTMGDELQNRMAQVLPETSRLVEECRETDYIRNQLRYQEIFAKDRLDELLEYLGDDFRKETNDGKK